MCLEIQVNIKENVSYLCNSSFDYIGWKKISAKKIKRREKKERQIKLSESWSLNLFL